MSAGHVAEWVLSGAVLLVVLTLAARSVLSAERRAQLRVLTRLRARRAELAAVAASIDDELFSPQTIREAVLTLLARAERWEPRHGSARPSTTGKEPIIARADAKCALIGAGLRITGKPKIDVLRVINRGREAEDRAIVRVRLRIHRDPKRLRESGLRELAGQEPAPDVSLGELIDPGAPAADRLRELAVLDDRFAPDLLEATLHHVLEAWELLTDGSQRPLEEVAAGSAVQALMHLPDGRGRRLIRDPELMRWEPIDVDVSSKVPSVRLRVVIKAAIWGPGKRGPLGSDSERHRHALIWTLEPQPAGGHEIGWRLVDGEDVGPA